MYAPASTAIFATVDTDTEGDQWQALDALLAKFPDGKGAIDKALGELGSEEGLSFENDIRPAVGDEIAIVGFDTKGEDVVLLTQPSDSAKLKKIVATGDEPGVTEELEDGWWAAAGSQESLDAFNEARKSGDSLADEDAYQDATEDLFEDAIATLYVNGRVVETAQVEPELDGAQNALAKCFGGDEDATGASFALAARAEENGIRIGGDVASTVIPVGDEGGAELDEFFRSDALAFVSTSGIGDAIREIVKCASANDSATAQTLAQIQFALGLSVEGDIAGLFDGATGVALYAPASDTSYVSLTPTVVFATEVSDEDETMALLENLVTKAGGLMGFMGGQESSIGLEETSIEGMNAKVLLNAGNPVLYFATTDGKLVASNTEAGLAALKSGSSLADDPAYSAGREAAGRLRRCRRRGVREPRGRGRSHEREPVWVWRSRAEEGLERVRAASPHLREPRAAQVALLLERRARRRLGQVRRVPRNRLARVGSLPGHAGAAHVPVHLGVRHRGPSGQDGRPDLGLRARRRPRRAIRPGRVACETLITTGLVVVAGEITTETSTWTFRGSCASGSRRSATTGPSTASTPRPAA